MEEIKNEEPKKEREISERLEKAEKQLKEREKIFYNYIMGKKVSGTTHASAGTESTHAHSLGKTPKFVFITSKGNGVVYISTASDADNIYIKGSANSVDFEAFCIL